jgi:hypothetical protein
MYFRGLLEGSQHHLIQEEETMEIRIKPGREGHTFRLEVWIGSLCIESHEHNHSQPIVKKVEFILNAHEGAFSTQATWGGSSVPPPGR